MLINGKQKSQETQQAYWDFYEEHHQNLCDLVTEKISEVVMTNKTKPFTMSCESVEDLEQLKAWLNFYSYTLNVKETFETMSIDPFRPKIGVRIEISWSW